MSWVRRRLGLMMVFLGAGGGESLAQFGPSITASAAVNSNAGGDSGDDKTPRMATDGCTWVAVWESDENLGGAGTDKDIFVARSLDYGNTWTTVATLNSNATTDSGDDKKPWVETDGLGNWVAVWSSKEDLAGNGNDGDIFVARSTDNGATWTAPAVVNSNAISDSDKDDRPFLETDGLGNWVVLWQSDEDLGAVESDIFCARSTDNGATWTAIATLNSNAATDTGDDKEASLVTDGSGNWVAIWKSGENLGGAGTDDDIFVSRSADNGATWTTVALLNSNATTDTGDDKKPVVETDAAGNWLAVWESKENLSSAGTDSDIFVSRSTDNGATWTTVALLNSTAATDGTGDDDKEPSVETDRAGSWVVVWQSNDDLGGAGVDDDIFAARSTDNGVTWTTVDTLNSNATTDSGDDKKPFVVNDLANSWMVVWESDDALGATIGTDTDILRATFVLTEISTCEYVERFQSWSAGSADTWETKDLTALPFNVPPSAVAEIAVRNADTLNELSGGVRAVSSTLQRRLALHEAEAGGNDILVMHVQADASSQIQHYSDDTSQVDFVLLGYWDCGTYVEAFDTLSAGADATWTDQDLCPFGVVPNGAAEIVMANTLATAERDAGVRTNGSALARMVKIHEAEAGGVDVATMFVRADVTAAATVELYAQVDADIDFYLVGYWSVAPLAYNELFVDVGSPSTGGTWEDLDLTASGVPENAVAEFALTNDFATVPNQIGVRGNGSCLVRVLDLQEAEAVGSDVGRMHVPTDSTATIEFQHEDVSEAHTFRLIGYWGACNSSISYVISDLGAVTASESSLGLHLNATADVAGFDEDAAGAPGAWFSECGTLTSLGTLGGADGEAIGLNDAEEVVGWAHDASGNRRAFNWTSGAGMTNLGTVSGRTASEATAINASSEVVGTVLVFGVPPDRRLAFIDLPVAAYTLSSGMTSLGTFGGDESVAMDINDSGQVTGGAQYSNQNMRPFRWANGTMTDLGTLGGEAFALLHRGQAINSSGDVVGLSYTAGGAPHAFFWNGSMSDLGVLTGGDTSWALGINDSNVAVGMSNVTGGAFHAFVWDSTNGMRDLNDLISGSWTLTRALDINNNGMITGWGTNPSGDVRAFLLTPSCSSSGGGAAAATASGGVIGTGSGKTDGTGAFAGVILDAEGESLGEITISEADPDVAVEFEVVQPDEPGGAGIGPTPGTLEGFADGVALRRTLAVATSAGEAYFVATVSMTFFSSELDDAAVDPEEVELHVFDAALDSPPGVWIPAGANIGESAPTGIVGDSGFVVDSDSTIRFWAVRNAAGVFAVGAPAAAQGGEPDQPDQNQSPDELPNPQTLPPVCGLGSLPVSLVALTLLVAVRTRRYGVLR